MPSAATEQPAHLHFIGRVKLAVYFLRLHKKIEQRLTIDGSDFLPCPIHTHGCAIINAFRATATRVFQLQEVADKPRTRKRRLVISRRKAPGYAELADDY
jgi:hypothetical protein